MKKTIVVLFLIILLHSIAFGQANQSKDMFINPYWDFYSLNYQSVENAGKGYTGIASDGGILSTALNPASLNLDKKFQVYAEYYIKTNLDWGKSLNIKDGPVLKQNHPTFAAGFGYRICKEFQAGIIYRSERNFLLDLGTVYETDEFGNRTGRVFYPYEDFITHTISAPVVYEYKSFKFGANLNILLLHSRRNLTNGLQTDTVGDASANYVRFVPDFGIKFTPADFLSVGVTFTPEFKQDITWDFPNPIVDENTYSYFPMKIGAGFELKLLKNKLLLSGEYRYEKTSVYTIGGLYDYNYKDRHNFHFGAEYKPNNALSIRGGFFTKFDIRDQILSGSYTDPLGEYDQYYATAGLGYKYKDFDFNIAAVNAFSKKVGLFRINIGAAYNFNSF